MPFDDDESSNSEIKGNHWGVTEEDDTEPEVTVSEDSVDESTTTSNENDNSSEPSPIVGVILMVAVTVILVAIVGAFTIDITKDVQSDEPFVIVEKHPENESITVTVLDIPENYEYVTVEGPSKTAKVRSERTLTFDNPPANAELTVSGTYRQTAGLYGAETGTKTILLYSGEVTVTE